MNHKKICVSSKIFICPQTHSRYLLLTYSLPALCRDSGIKQRLQAEPVLHHLPRQLIFNFWIAQSWLCNETKVLMLLFFKYDRCEEIHNLLEVESVHISLGYCQLKPTLKRLSKITLQYKSLALVMQRCNRCAALVGRLRSFTSLANLPTILPPPVLFESPRLLPECDRAPPAFAKWRGHEPAPCQE